MSSTDYAAKLAAIEAISTDSIKKPNLPIKHYIQEAENLYQWVQPDQDAPAAYGLRDQMLRTMRYAYRHDEVLLKRVAQIAEGTGHADMIQDLNDIAILGRAHPEPLQVVGVGAEQLQQAATTANAMAELLAQVNGERAGGNSARVIRDQAYMHLKEAVDEIRACGQFVFWDNESRQEGYHSRYRRSQRRTTPSPEPITEETPA